MFLSLFSLFISFSVFRRGRGKCYVRSNTSPHKYILFCVPFHDVYNDSWFILFYVFKRLNILNKGSFFGSKKRSNNWCTGRSYSLTINQFMLTRLGAIRLFYSEAQRLANIDINSADPISSSEHHIYRPTQFNMSAKTVANLINKTLEQTPKFCGKPDENVEEWFQDLQAKLRMAEITEIQALQIMSTFLDGPAKVWFTENHETFESWTQFKAQFLHTYSSAATKQLASHRLRNRHQRVDEPVIEYYTDVMKLCKIVDPNMTDVSKLDHLSHGLKTSLIREVLRNMPCTPAEFLTYAQKEEGLDTLVNSSATTSNQDDKNDATLCASCVSSMSQQNLTKRSLPSPQRAYQRNTPNSISKPFTPNNLYPSQRVLRCYNCGKLGHIARNCRYSKNY